MSHIEEHSKKPEEARNRIVQLMGDVPRIELLDVYKRQIRRWAENDKTKGVPKQGIPDYTCKEGESL